MRLFDMTKLAFPVRISTAVVDGTFVAVELKKSKMLLLVTMLPVLIVFAFVVVPTIETHFVGRFAPAGPMLLLAITLLLLPTTLVPLATVVLNRTFPPAVPTRTVDEPRMLQFATILFCAPPLVAAALIKRIVLVPAVLLVLVFEIVSML